MASAAYSERLASAEGAREAIGLFLDATGMTQNKFAEWLGHGPDFVYHINSQDFINLGTEISVFRLIYSRWPEGHEMPDIVRRFARNHLPKVHRKPLTSRTRLRPCMHCKESFESEGAHNRMCDPCRRIVYNQSAAFI